ncbi:HipA N-terminal domain-containing protein, partial [Arthrospira platensis SPKY1]|nr:HipA N-terminal domain-containing protein [Arthrospira platensis SPKY1]
TLPGGNLGSFSYEAIDSEGNLIRVPVNVNILTAIDGNAGDDLPVGRLALRDRNTYFEYEQDFLQSHLELSPFKLPLKAGVCLGDDRVFEGLFGVFNDSLPDGWGR